MSIEVGEVKIDRGEKVKGFLKVGEASTHEIRIPYIVVNGSMPGPKLRVLGGVHPLEYASIEGVLRVAQEIEADGLRGALLVVPVVNTDGFHARAAFNNPIDHQNQNRVFPGDPAGTMSRRVAYTVFDAFVSKADYLIDSHGGDLTEDIHKFVIIGRTDDEDLHRKMVEMASCYDAAYIRVSEIRGSTGEALRRYGIPCITPESGTPYPVREDEVEFHHEGIINVMRHLGMLEGEPVMRELRVNPPRARLYAERGGIWRRRVEAGQRVKKEMVLGEVVNLLGETLQIVKAPFDGIANHIRTPCEASSGDTLLWVIDA
ncbi:MAG: succinylglutamate desuccinylase/aspartoacylase family protein [Candidatus Bathyarchaeia archaeon]